MSLSSVQIIRAWHSLWFLLSPLARREKKLDVDSDCRGVVERGESLLGETQSLGRTGQGEHDAQWRDSLGTGTPSCPA